jgi:putative acetyltransferase
MRTDAALRGQGVGRVMLEHILAQAQALGYRRISLETGSQPFFEPACRLYLRYGFVDCAPFGSYQPDPNSRFLTRMLIAAP